jgi:hypothetical protein
MGGAESDTPEQKSSDAGRKFHGPISKEVSSAKFQISRFWNL